MRSKLALLLLCSLASSSVFIQKLIRKHDEKHTMNRNIGHCVAEIAKTYFLRLDYVPLIIAMNDSLFVESDNTLGESVSPLVRYVSRFSVVLIIKDLEIKSPHRCKNFIIVTNSVLSLIEYLYLIPAAAFKRDGQIIVVLKTNASSKKTIIQSIQEILDFCWSLKMINLLLVTQVEDSPSIFTFFPYNEKSCGDSEMVELDRWVNSTFEKQVILYPLKVLELYGCPVVVTALSRFPHIVTKRWANGSLKTIQGVEGNLIKMLAGLLNFTLKLVEPKDVYQWGFWNGSQWTGASGDLIHGRADIGVGAYLPDLNMLHVIDFSHGYDTIDLIWATPTFEKISTIAKLLAPFKKNIWFLIILTILFLIFLLNYIKTKIPLKSYQVEKVSIFILGLTLGMSIKMPNGRFVCYVISIWMWMAMVLRSLYQASLVDYLTHNEYVDRVTTMKEMIEQNFQFYGTHQSAGFMENVSDKTVEYILKTLVISETDADFDKMTEKIASGEVLAAAMHLKTRIPELNYYFKNIGSLRILKETYRSQIITLAFAKFSPLVEAANEWIHKISETGFFDKWFEDYYWPKVVPNDQPKVIKMRHLATPFVILLVGLLASFFIFLGEVYRPGYYRCIAIT